MLLSLDTALKVGIPCTTQHECRKGYYLRHQCTQCNLTSIMSLPLLYPETMGNGCAQSKPSSLLSHFLSCITDFDIKIIHQIIQTTRPHASRCHHCHYCSIDFVLFHNVTCYTYCLLLDMHVNTTTLLNITCTLVATKHDIREVRVYT